MGCTNEEMVWQSASVSDFTVEIDRETEVITQSRCTDPFSCSLWIYRSSQATRSNAEFRAAVFCCLTKIQYVVNLNVFQHYQAVSVCSVIFVLL